ncbi:MAG: tight adherence protein [Actinomycetota bacterium]|jgi:tight adherence protein C
MAAVAALAVFGALALVLLAVLMQADERATVRESLRRIGDFESEATMREQELTEPILTRVFLPVGRSFMDVGRRFTPGDYVDKSRRKLLIAGRGHPEAVDRFLAVRVLTIALIPVWFFLAFFVLPLKGMAPVGVFALLAFASFAGPDAWLNREMAERQHSIRVKLPDILDLLVISVEAGLGFEQALDRTVSAVPGPLSDEFNRMLGEVRAGATRADSMRALDGRTDVPEVRSFVLAILQADTFGVSIGRVLRSQAEEMRIKRRQMAQEEAQKAPVKMLIPMVFCIFPALFVVIIGPAIINIYQNFK